MRVLSALILLCSIPVALGAESAAGVQWTAPVGWTRGAPQPMRAATYVVPASPSDAGQAECGVYFFGAGQGGSVEANLDRWSGQFSGPDGKPATPRVSSRPINGLTVHLIDTAGAYSGLGGPMSSAPRVAPDYRLLGAIVEGPGGNIFVKFTGPARTVAANRTQFEQLLASFRRGQ